MVKFLAQQAQAQIQSRAGTTDGAGLSRVEHRGIAVQAVLSCHLSHWQITVWTTIQDCNCFSVKIERRVCTLFKSLVLCPNSLPHQQTNSSLSRTAIVTACLTVDTAFQLRSAAE